LRIKLRATARPDSRTAKAYKLALQLTNNKLTNEDLAKAIYTYAFKNSSVFAKSKITGSTFFRAKKVAARLENIHTNFHRNNVNPNSRMGRILAGIDELLDNNNDAAPVTPQTQSGSADARVVSNEVRRTQDFGGATLEHLTRFSP